MFCDWLYFAYKNIQLSSDGSTEELKVINQMKRLN